MAKRKMKGKGQIGGPNIHGHANSPKGKRSGGKKMKDGAIEGPNLKKHANSK